MHNRKVTVFAGAGIHTTGLKDAIETYGKANGLPKPGVAPEDHCCLRLRDQYSAIERLDHLATPAEQAWS
jgi:hypothetical protein